MNLDTYIIFTRYFTCFIMSFFVFQFFMSVLHYRKHRLRSSLWHNFMCLTTALYCFVFAFNTHYFDQTLSNSLLSIFWLLAYSSYFCYLKAIEAYLERDIKLLTISKLYCIFLASINIINFLSIYTLNKNFLFSQNEDQFTNFAKMMSFTVSPNNSTLVFGGLGVIIVIFSSIVIWKELGASKKRELALHLGIIVSVTAVLNDSALGLELAGSLIPLYYVGNAFEAVRLNWHYQEVARKKITNLESTIDELSQIAQYSYTAANVSHDIRNHLTIVKATVQLLKKDDPGNSKYDLLLKHINQISDVTAVYSSLFRMNGDIEKEKLNLGSLMLAVKDLVKKKVESSRTRLEIDIPDTVEVKSNEIALTLSLVNLINNAVDEVGAIPDSWVRISFDDKDQKVLVTDSGCGIPENIVNNIFEYNFSTKKKVGGSGLGLAISRHLLKKSGAELSYSSSSSNTTFVIKFL